MIFLRYLHSLFLSLALLTVFVTETSAEKLRMLPDILDPKSMHADEEHLYIVDGHQIQIYALDDLRLIKKFGTIGKGPDAFRANPQGDVHLYVDVQSDHIVVSSYEKVSIFSKEGECITSMNPYPQTEYVVPFGENYIASFCYIHEGTGKSADHILIFNEKLEFVKKITEGFLGSGQAKGFGGPDRKLHIDMISDFYGFRVFGDKIFVGDSSKGYFLEVYDCDGKKLYEIEKEYAPVPLNDEYRKKRTEEIKALPSYTRYKDFVVIEDREHYPAFQDFSVTDGKIYVYTYKEIDDKQEIHILDLQGNFGAAILVPQAKVRVIRHDRYSYIKDNESGERELHSVNLLGEGDVER